MSNYFLLFAFSFSFNGLLAQHELRYQLKQGESFKVEQIAVQKMNQDLDGAINHNTNTVRAIYEFKVDSVFNNRYILTTVFNWMQFKSESDTFGVFLDVDTRKDTTGMNQDALLMHTIFSSMLEKPITVNLYKTGKVLSIEGTDTMIDAMLDKIGVEEVYARNMIKKQVEKDFGNESLAESMEQLFYIYPDEPVRVGDRWENSYTGTLKVDTVWTLKEFSMDTFVVNGSATVAMEETQADTGVQVSLTGNQETLAILDQNNGFINEVTITQETQGATRVEGMNFPTSMTSTITYKRL